MATLPHHAPSPPPSPGTEVSLPPGVQAALQALSDSPWTPLLTALPTPLVLITAQRQIVWCNEPFAQLAGRPRAALPGQLLGSALACSRSQEAAPTCGHQANCPLCVAGDATLGAASALTGAAGLTCRLTRTVGQRQVTAEWRLWTAPMTLAGQALLAVALHDEGGEKRRQVLERTFFHDLLNTAGCLRGLLDFAGMTLEDGGAIDHEMVDNMARIADQVVDEIVAQRQLLAAEAGSLTVAYEPCHSGELLALLASDYQRHQVGQGRLLILSPGVANLPLVTDVTLLKRVLANLIKNALEATPVGEIVLLDCQPQGDSLRFVVHNPGEIPADVQQHIFQRSYSTRGAGRGIGTYSIRLLCEQYLQGRVSFTSTAAAGTTFNLLLPRRPAPPPGPVVGDPVAVAAAEAALLQPRR